MRGLLGAPLGALILLLAQLGPARAQMDSREAIALQNQILELRRDMQMLGQRGGYVAPPPTRGPGAGPSAGAGGEIVAQLLERVSTLEEEVRRLRGRLDEQSNQARRQYDELAKQNADLQFRLQQGGQQPSAPAAPGPTPPASTPAAPGAARRTPELAMQEGNAALARRDYPAAETAAREILASNRDTPRVADAQFLLAQSLVGRRDYQGAALAYDAAYKANRRGSRAPDSLLGLANALIAINEKQAACDPLERLRTEFPSARGDVREAASTARSRAGCR